MELDEYNPDNFIHCTSLDKKPFVEITRGEHKGKVGTLLGQWTYPFHLWVVWLRDEPNEYAKVQGNHFKYIQGGN